MFSMLELIYNTLKNILGHAAIWILILWALGGGKIVIHLNAIDYIIQYFK